jgi:hypothetical protein
MAQKVIVLKTCDLFHDGDNVEAPDTVDFGFDGATYQLDLCAEHSMQVQNQLQELIAHARRVDRGRRHGARPAGAPSSRGGGARSNEDLAAIRVWARKKGYTVSDRGRISSEVRDAYEKANK